MPSDSNGFSEYKRLIMDTLERHEEMHNETQDTLEGIRQDIASLKVRSGLWGAAAGAIPALVILILLYLESRP